MAQNSRHNRGGAAIRQLGPSEPGISTSIKALGMLRRLAHQAVRRCTPIRASRRAFSSASSAPKKTLLWPWVIGAGLVGGSSYYFFARSDSNESSDPIKTASDIINTFKEPAFEKLLPDKINDPNHSRPYTLVIDLDKFLVCHLWDRDHSKWRIAKRPGAELFLFYASQMYEVVVFSSLPQHEGDAIVKKLDPFGCVSYGLYRFATKFDKGRYLKDVYMLNRDPSKVIVIGHDVEGFSPHPEHLLPVNPWEGDPNDHALEDSIDFLEMLAFSRLADIRTVVEKNKGTAFPTDFEAKQEAVFERARSETIQGLRKRSSNFFFKLFGLAPSSVDESKYPTYEQKKAERTEARRKEWSHIRGLMQKQLEAEMEKEKAFYAEHKMSLFDLFSKGPPQPPPPAAAATSPSE